MLITFPGGRPQKRNQAQNQRINADPQPTKERKPLTRAAMHKIKCLGTTINSALIPEEAREYVASFPEAITLRQLYTLIDSAWDELLSKHSYELSDAFFASFYSHPVWSLNTVFTETDPQSVIHRRALANQILKLGIRSIADIGGGNGSFLRILKSIHPTATCILCEPYLNQGIIHEINRLGVSWQPDLPGNVDAYTLIDVLEHISDPLTFLKEIIDSAKDGSFFFFGNCFFPVIKCHLPSTFYLRNTFNLAARCMGLKLIGRVSGAEYISVYKLERSSEAPLIVSLKLILPTLSEFSTKLCMS